MSAMTKFPKEFSMTSAGLEDFSRENKSGRRIGATATHHGTRRRDHESHHWSAERRGLKYRVPQNDQRAAEEAAVRKKWGGSMVMRPAPAENGTQFLRDGKNGASSVSALIRSARCGLRDTLIPLRSRMISLLRSCRSARFGRHG